MIATLKQQLVDEGCAAISARVDAHKRASLPDCCTPQLAWDTLRKAIAEQSLAGDTYYFSVQELQLFMAALGVQVEIYTYKEEGHAWEHLQPPDYFDEFIVSKHVELLLGLRDDPKQKNGGHFCRLWSMDDWELQPFFLKDDSASESGNSCANAEDALLLDSHDEGETASEPEHPKEKGADAEIPKAKQQRRSKILMQRILNQ